MEVLIFIRPPMVAHFQKAAIEQIAAQGLDLLVGEFQPAHLLHEGKRIVKERIVGDFDLLGNGIDLDRGHLVQAEGKVQIRIGPVGSPSIAGMIGQLVRPRGEPQAHKREHVLLECRVDVPAGHPRTIVRQIGNGRIGAVKTAAVPARRSPRRSPRRIRRQSRLGRRRAGAGQAGGEHTSRASPHITCWRCLMAGAP